MFTFRRHPDVAVNQPFIHMRLSTLTTFTVAALTAGTASAQLQRIVVQGSGGPAVYTDLDSAITAAQPGDKLYLSGGTFALPAGQYVFSKPLHLIGAGMHPDSSGVTGTTSIAITPQHFLITTAASGSSFTGIVFGGNGSVAYGTSADDDDPTGMIFQRCEFKRGLYLGFAEGASSSSSLDECVVRGGGTIQFQGRGGQAVVTRCIIDGCPVNLFRPSGLFMKNCVVLDARLQNSDNPIVQNCVFTYNGAPLWQVSGAQVSNCLVTGGSMFSNSNTSTETNNIFGIPAGSIFVNEADNAFQYSDDLHLVPGSPGAGTGNDGHDIGLYGTHAPFKAGNVPYNPHYQQADIAPATDWNGGLPVQIRTAAQTH